MDIQDLRIFISLAGSGSATRTAKELAMTQPGVSQHLAKLEEKIGKKLFDRNGKKLELNDNGLDFIEKAKKVVQEFDSLINSPQGDFCPIGSLRLGVTDSASISIIPKALAKFRKKFPGIKITIDVSDSSDIEHGVLRGHYDFGIISGGDHPHSGLDEEELYKERIDAIVAKQHPLSKKKSVSLEELSKYPLFVYPRKSRTRRMIDDVFHKYRIHPAEIMDVYYHSGSARLAETGMGVALLSEAFIVGEMQKHKCVHLRITGDPFKRAISLIRKKNVTPSDASRAMAEIVMEFSVA